MKNDLREHCELTTPKEKQLLDVIAELKKQLQQKCENEKLLWDEIVNLKKENHSLKALDNGGENQGCGLIAFCSKRQKKRKAKKSLKQRMFILRIEHQIALDHKKQEVDKLSSELECEKQNNATLEFQLAESVGENKNLTKRLTNILIKSGKDRRCRNTKIRSLERQTVKLQDKSVAFSRETLPENNSMAYKLASLKFDIVNKDRYIEYCVKEIASQKVEIKYLQQELGYNVPESNSNELIADWLAEDPPDLKF